jgi:hypothetical protein
MLAAFRHSSFESEAGREEFNRHREEVRVDDRVCGTKQRCAFAADDDAYCFKRERPKFKINFNDDSQRAVAAGE